MAETRNTVGYKPKNAGKTRPKARLATQAAKDSLVERVQQGETIASALEHISYKRKTYEMWRKKDTAFATAVDVARQLREPGRVTKHEKIGFEEWRLKYLGVVTPWHQLQWVDLLEGREPRELHESQTFEKNKGNRLLINCPPFHGKTVALSIDYCTYRLCLDASFRILLISAAAELAKDFLFGIKARLTDPRYVDLQLAYAPDGGWESTAESWTESRIVFSLEARSGEAMHEKDANVQALGMRSKVYGRRADLIIVDDGVDHTNAAEYIKQMRWLRQMVESRLELSGKMLVIGTRVAPVDLYSELMNPDNYASQRVPWTYLASPAILEEHEDPKDHVTLWPYAQDPWVGVGDDFDTCICEDTAACSAGVVIDGDLLFPRWDGIHLERGPKDANDATSWALIYQQRSVPDDATFPEYKIAKATNRHRLCGMLEVGRSGHPPQGMNGMFIVAGLDPSIKGFAGIIILAVDPETHMRHVLGAWNMKAPTAQQLKDKMKELTTAYSVDEWRVEKTGLLQFFTQDQQLRQWFQDRSIRFTEHLTSGQTKWDPGFGVSSMSSLLGEYDQPWDDKRSYRCITPPLIEFPRHNQDGMKALVHQLITWTPELDPAKTPCDLVMALWFANTGAREYLGVGRNGNVLTFGRTNRFVQPRYRKQHTTVRFADFRQAAR